MHQKNENFQGLHTNVSREIVPLSCAKPADCSDEMTLLHRKWRAKQSSLSYMSLEKTCTQRSENTRARLS